MTDLELVKACAEVAGGLPPMVEYEGKMRYGYKSCLGPEYNPIKDNAEAMALVKRLGLCIQPPIMVRDEEWHVWVGTATWKEESPSAAANKDLNRAIVECVAKTQR